MTNEYIKYLGTRKWRKKAEACKKLAGYKCNRCGSSDRQLNAHHKTYENVFKEPQRDLECLCDVCHRKVHSETFTYSKIYNITIITVIVTSIIAMLIAK